MKRQGLMGSALAVFAIGAALAVFAASGQAEPIYDLPTYSAVVDKAVSAENLKAVASQSSDPEVLLGLDFLVRPGNAVRQEIAEMAVKAKPDYAPIVAVIAVRMDAVDEKTIAELIKSDPDNAYGYYLQGNLLYKAEKEKEALAAWRKASACPELRLYESVTGPALFKALDALDLKGRDRVCALTWAAERAGFTRCLDMVNALGEMAGKADLGTRKEISEILLLLAGQLYTTNIENRWDGEVALQYSFRYKAEAAAAEKSPAMNGYAAVTQALVSVQQATRQPGFLGISNLSRDTAMYLPSRVSEGFRLPFIKKEGYGYSYLPESDKPAFDKAEANAESTAEALIDLAAAAPDEIMGAYLKGLPLPGKNSSFPWVSRLTYAERVMLKRRDVVKAVVAFDEALDALSEAADKGLLQRNMHQMMEIGKGIIEHVQDDTFPDSLNVLFEKKHVEALVEPKSLLSGRTYVYVAAGEKYPEKSSEIGKFIVLYDDDVSVGCYCLFADGHISRLTVDQAREQLRKQGKQGP